MPLPPWNEVGLLPPGIHSATLPDMYERFVLDAPHRDQRELLYAALTVHLGLIKRLIPAGRAWVDGSFSACKPEPPDDVDIVICPDDWNALKDQTAEQKAKLYSLLTLQEVAVVHPEALWVSRLQPVGGVIDAYLCKPGEETSWQYQWSCVMDPAGGIVPGLLKGYAEVAW